MRKHVTDSTKKAVTMKQKFEIELKVNGIGDVDLYVKSKDTRYKINGAKNKGEDIGL